jgi:hypothetical protein
MPDPTQENPSILPTLFDADGWRRPASEDELRTTVATLFTLLEPAASPERVKAVRETIGLKGYTSAELALIAREVPFRKPYGPRGVHLDLIGDVVEESRKDRNLIHPERLLSEADRLAALGLPGVDPAFFHVAGFDQRNRPVYRYAPHLGPAPNAPTPMLTEASQPKRLRDGTEGTFALGDLAPKRKSPADDNHLF